MVGPATQDSHWAYVVAVMTRYPQSVEPGTIKLVSEIDYDASPVSYSFKAEADINYAYRQLSRALHPDKNPDIPEAHDAFKRLTDAAAELKEGLEEQRSVLRAICLVMGVVVTPEMTERPQEALFAEATRLLHAVLALTGEGEVPGPALSRSLVAFTASTSWTNCRPQVLLSEWFDSNRLLDLFGSASLRTAYDCAPRRYRAQFLCALNRTTMAEAKRSQGMLVHRSSEPPKKEQRLRARKLASSDDAIPGDCAVARPPGQDQAPRLDAGARRGENQAARQHVG
eukprot:g18453.t1